MEFHYNDIIALEQRYRASFINSVGGFKSVVLIGTKNNEGQSNLAIFNSFFHLGAHPPLFGLIVRPDTVERHTLSNILETGKFTVNHINESIYIKAHQTSARYPRGISEFNSAGLTEQYIANMDVPFVKESFIKIGAELKQKIDISDNNTVLLISCIKYVNLPDNCIMTDGFVDIQKAGTITCSGLDAYYTTNKLSRLTYAKPEKLPDVLPDFINN